MTGPGPGQGQWQGRAWQIEADYSPLGSEPDSDSDPGRGGRTVLGRFLGGPRPDGKDGTVTGRPAGASGDGPTPTAARGAGDPGTLRAAPGPSGHAGPALGSGTRRRGRQNSAPGPDDERDGGAPGTRGRDRSDDCPRQPGDRVPDYAWVGWTRTAPAWEAGS